MERLLIGKIFPSCVSRACLARISKDGRSHCKWRGYVNCLSGEFRLTRCSCISTKQTSREYRAVRNHLQTSSHVLRFNTRNGNEWILLLPKQGGYEQRRHKSSNKGDEDHGKFTGDFHIFLVSLLGLAMTIHIYRGMRMPNGRLPRHVSWEEFENEYLKKGRVKEVVMYGSNIKALEVPVAELYRPSVTYSASEFSDTYVIVETDGRRRGEFQQRLHEFEEAMHVPSYERIPTRMTHGNLYLADDPKTYSTVMSMIGICGLIAVTSLVMSVRGMYREHIRRGFGSFRNYFKQESIRVRQFDEQRRQKIEEEIQRRREETKSREEEQGKDKETFADMVRERIFQDKGFKIKRGDLIMKDELSMKDVAGLHEPKVEILEFIDYVKNPEMFQTLGAKTPRGALLLGPPGCGKTLLAKALAAECGVPFYFVAASELDDMIVGVGAQRVRALFKKAREQSPCIIYIDELDAIGMRRAADDKPGQSSSDKEMTLNQLLAEMDGMHSREGVIILASTNRADMLDKALLRPGRFDRHIAIDLPTFKERIEHFDLYLSKLALSSPVSTYSTRLSQLTPGMSGADIAYICNEAAIHAARNNNKKVTAKDFEYAVERKIAGAAKATNTIGLFEKKVIAYHESGHALVGWLLEHTDALLKVTIVPRTSGVGGFAQYLPKENKLYSQEHLFDMMCMALGGRVAETVIFDHLSTGAQDDLRKVTQIAYAQIRSFGMSKSIGLLSFPDDQYGLKPFSKQTSNMLDLEARQLVSKAYKHTEELLMNNKDKLHKLSALLLERETISAQDVEDLIGPPPFGAKQMFDPLTFYEDELRSTGKTEEKKPDP